MFNKKFFLAAGILVLLVGATAFIAGRMLNGQVNPLSLFGFGGNGRAITVIPAEELPKTQPDVVGNFVERKDNTVVIQPIPLKTGGAGIVARSSSDSGSTAQIEVVVTNQTTIYLDTTSELNGPPLRDGQSLQQTVEESTLDGLSTQSTVMVWGPKSGDRITAKVLIYSNPVNINRP